MEVTRPHVVHVVCTDAFAGVERYVRNSALALSAAGCRVTVIGGDEGSMRAPLASAGIEWLPGATVRAALRSLRRVRRPDVVNSHMTEADLAAVLWAGIHRVPVVSTRHFAGRRGSSVGARLAAAGIRRVIRTQIAISDFVAAHIDGDAHVVRTGVDDASVGHREPEPVVLVMQRLEAEKATDQAIRAWAALSDRRNWRMIVAGDGSQRQSLEALASELGVAESTEFLGFQPDVEPLLERAAILVAPTEQEGLGLAVIEAMSYGIPVVACAGGGHLESIGGVEGAALFEPSDIDGAARLIEALMRDAPERERYGSALRQRQRTEFSTQRQTDATLAVFDLVDHRRAT